MVKYSTLQEGLPMERILIYGAAAVGITAGLVLYYYKPAPFGSRYYDKKKRK